eukprot:EG_transcript_22478
MGVSDGLYAGRIFRAPRSKSPDEATELWINIGWHLRGEQVFPEYLDALRPACSEEAYQQMVAELKELLDRHGFHLNRNVAVSCATLGLSSLHIAHKERRLTRQMAAIVAKHGGPALRLEFQRTGQEVAYGYDEVSMDQWGEPLVSRRHGNFHADFLVDEPCWPPLGYSVVAHLPGDVPWPPKAPNPAPAG